MWTVLLAAALAGGCVEAKEEVVEDFSDLAGQDTKSDYFSWRLKLLGTVGDGWKTTWYTPNPRFRGWIFYADPTDEVTVKLSSYYGDPVTWILDTDFRVLAKNDDASDGDTDSFIRMTVPDPGSRDRRYYVVFRDYALESHKFYLDHDLTEGSGPTDWAAQARAWYEQLVFSGPWRIAGEDLVTEPDALPSTTRMEEFSERTEGWDVPWLYEGLPGGALIALTSAWQERFFVDLYDAGGTWFAHGWGRQDADEQVTELHWDADDNDPTICVCDGGGSATCTWLDGGTFSSGSIPCE